MPAKYSDLSKLQTVAKNESKLNAVVHCSAEASSLTDLQDTFVKKVTLCNRHKSFCVVPVDSISHTLFVFDNAGGDSDKYLHSLPERKWGRSFGNRIPRSDDRAKTINFE